MNNLSNPRILIVTPEVTYLPDGMGDISNGMNAKAGGLADVSAALIGELYRQGADVHVALPDYRSIFTGHLPPLIRRKRQINRIMLQSAATFNHQVTAQHYIDLYEKMLRRPLINPMHLAGQVIPINRDKKTLYGQTIADRTGRGLASQTALRVPKAS